MKIQGPVNQEKMQKTKVYHIKPFHKLFMNNMNPRGGDNFEN
jgi:hypothetical protein